MKTDHEDILVFYIGKNLLHRNCDFVMQFWERKSQLWDKKSNCLFIFYSVVVETSFHWNATQFAEVFFNVKLVERQKQNVICQCETVPSIW